MSVYGVCIYDTSFLDTEEKSLMNVDMKEYKTLIIFNDFFCF